MLRCLSAEQNGQIDQTDQKAENGTEQVDVFELLLHDAHQQALDLKYIELIDFVLDHAGDIECFHQWRHFFLQKGQLIGG